MNDVNIAKWCRTSISGDRLSCRWQVTGIVLSVEQSNTHHMCRTLATSC